MSCTTFYILKSLSGFDIWTGPACCIVYTEGIVHWQVSMLQLEYNGDFENKFVSSLVFLIHINLFGNATPNIST